MPARALRDVERLYYWFDLGLDLVEELADVIGSVQASSFLTTNQATGFRSTPVT